MDFLEEEIIEKKTEEKFREFFTAQYKLSRKLLLIVFGIIGLLFLSLGTTLVLCGIEDEEMLVGLPLAIMGGFFCLVDLIIFLVMPKKMKFNYTKFKLQFNNNNKLYGYYTGAHLLYSNIKNSIMIEYLEQKVDKLEKIKLEKNKF